MSDGYIRQSSGNIVTGHVIAAADLNAEFNALQSAFDASVGHIHDGTTGGGGLIPSVIFTALAVSGTDTIVVTGTSPANFQLNNGILFTFTPAGINTTTSPTINVNGTGAIPLMKITGAGVVVPAIGDLNPLSPVLMQYNAAGNYWLWILPVRSYSLKTSTATALNFGSLYQFYIATSSVTFTITHSTNLNNSWYCYIFAEGGNATITPNAADSINGGTAGASVTVPQGNFAWISTDGAGNIFVTNTNYFFANTFQTSGNFPVTLTATGSTNVTLPTTGTLITSANVGTITSGTWNGTIISPTYGGTGVNNGSSTITIGGNLTHSGAFTQTFIATANTSVTLPVTGTLATLAGTEALTNKTINGLTITNSTGTLTIASGKTVTINNTLTLAGTDATTLTFQGTDTYVGRATTDTLTNKTFDTAGTGNSFKINGTAITAVTGTGSAVLAASPALTGTPTAPTAAAGTNTTQLATTAFINAAGVPIRTVHVQTFSSGGTYTPSTGMVFCIAEAVGGGAGGGGVLANGANTGAASGGGSGSYSKALFTAAQIGASATVVIGAAGAAGASGNNNGGNGGNTTLGTTLLVANGGTGGGGTTTNASFMFVAGGAQGNTGSTTGTSILIIPGQTGFAGISYGPNAGTTGGQGGSSMFGAGGTNTNSTTGANGTGFGAGGSGGAGNTSTSAAGGAGIAGALIITEFCTQ